VGPAEQDRRATGAARGRLSPGGRSRSRSRVEPEPGGAGAGRGRAGRPAPARAGRGNLSGVPGHVVSVKMAAVDRGPGDAALWSRLYTCPFSCLCRADATVLWSGDLSLVSLAAALVMAITRLGPETLTLGKHADYLDILRIRLAQNRLRLEPNRNEFKFQWCRCDWRRNRRTCNGPCNG